MKRNDIMELRLRTATPVQCLYCETELKPFRGLFDEDFCCRDHRDKYFSSFRKAVSRLPVLDIPPAEPRAESVWPAMREAEEPVFSADSPNIPAETVEPSYTEALAVADEPENQPVEIPAETVEEPLPLAAFTAEEPVFSADSPAIPAETAEPSYAEALAVADEPENQPVAPPAEIPAEAVEETLPLAAFTAEEPAITAVYQETLEPPEADFLHLVGAAVAGAPSAPSASLDALPVSCAIEVPSGEMTWAAVLEIEQRWAEILEPPLMTEATLFAAAPVPFQPAQGSSIPLAAEMLLEAALPEAVEPAAYAQIQEACGYTSPWNYADWLAPAPLALTVESFRPAEDGAAWMPAAEFAELALTCLPIVSSPIAAEEISLVHEFYPPVLTPRGALLTDEEPEDAQDQTVDSPAPPETAPALVMNSTPVDGPALMPAFAAEMMPPALALSSARSSAPVPLSAPGLASTIEGQTNLAPELMADIPQSPASNQAAEPHTHAPLRPRFGSSVRIKNWRLRITFAKPA